MDNQTQNLVGLFREFAGECRAVGRKSRETMKGYEAAFKLLLKIQPGITLDTLSTRAMVSFFESLQNRERIVGRGKVKKGISNSTVATYRSKLNKFFEWLRIKKLLQSNPFDGIDYPNVDYDKKEFLTKEKVDRILASLTLGGWHSLLIKKRNIAIFNLLIFCGLRKGELIGLKVIDVDLDRRIMKVRGETSKSKRDRIVVLHPNAVSALTDYLNERRSNPKYKSEYLFVSNKGDDRLGYDGFKHLIETVRAKSGIRFHAHQFRHTFAMNMLNSGSDIMKVKQLLGHKDIRMTATYLRHIPSKAMRQDVESLNIDKFLHYASAFALNK